MSETGPVRHVNEDYFVSAEDLRLFVVADGMGGHAAGEVAARVAVESIESFIRRSHQTTDFSWPDGIEPTLSYEANRLKAAVRLANRRINRLAENHDDYLGMGTTVVCALLAEGQLVVAHVGDSRLYLYEKKVLTQLTQDDSWAAAICGSQDGHCDPASVRHVLTSVLGTRPEVEVHVLDRELKGDETLLLCSDGLHGAIPHETLRDILASDAEPATLARRLIHAALEHGSRDNMTALVVQCADTTPPSPAR